ncbi:MAG TPA: DUF2255 family protein [Streptosporangiaceae bacterium]|nr:DUF2255 family protein [Streptosporangiaceae bacterium]
MTGWTTEELDKIGESDELHLRSLRPDGTLRDPVTIWVVRNADDLYVRPVRGRDGWYRGTLSRRQGHIESGGVDKDVTFAEADTDPGVNAAIDAEYKAKYGAYPADFVDAVINAQARSATVKLMPR